MKRFRYQRICGIVCFICALVPAAAESFRVRKLHSVSLAEDSADGQTLAVGINDSIAVFLPDETEYLEGIELKMLIPQSVAGWRDSVACSVYDGIAPVPSSSQIDYSGTKIYVTPLPARLSWVLQIPLTEPNSLRDSPYATKASAVPDTSKKYTFIRFQPAMKGVPEETINAELSVSVKPILINMGKLLLSVLAGDGGPERCTVLIDGTAAADGARSFLLSPGVHNLSVQSEEYRTEVRSFYIDRAKTTELSVELKSLEPTLLITAPDTAAVYIDDEPYVPDGTEFVISEGEHRLRFLIGDYEIIRTLSVRKGKSYTANLAVDLQITEE